MTIIAIISTFVLSLGCIFLTSSLRLCVTQTKTITLQINDKPQGQFLVTLPTLRSCQTINNVVHRRDFWDLATLPAIRPIAVIGRADESKIVAIWKFTPVHKHCGEVVRAVGVCWSRSPSKAPAAADSASLDIGRLVTGCRLGTGYGGAQIAAVKLVLIIFRTFTFVTSRYRRRILSSKSGDLNVCDFFSLSFIYVMSAVFLTGGEPVQTDDRTLPSSPSYARR